MKSNYLITVISTWEISAKYNDFFISVLFKDLSSALIPELLHASVIYYIQNMEYLKLQRIKPWLMHFWLITN